MGQVVVSTGSFYKKIVFPSFNLHRFNSDDLLLLMLIGSYYHLRWLNCTQTMMANTQW
jgi:hypothetical protein